MTIASEITRINGNIAAAYTAASAKGATLPATENSDNLATCISSISGGGGGYSEVPSYSVSSGTASKRSLTLSGTEFASITSIANNGLQYAFYGNTVNGNLNFTTLASVEDHGLSNAFKNTSALS